MILAGTGHRPNKLGGYGIAAHSKLIKLAQGALLQLKPTLVISGMALGWDQALARACLIESIPFHAYIPFEGQEKKWPEEAQRNFNSLRAVAAEVVICCEGGYSAWKMQSRNERMVDVCNQVLAIWDGSEGGTYNCLKYAKLNDKPITNLWDAWNKQ